MRPEEPPTSVAVDNLPAPCRGARVSARRNDAGIMNIRIKTAVAATAIAAASIGGLAACGTSHAITPNQAAASASAAARTGAATAAAASASQAAAVNAAASVAASSQAAADKAAVANRAEAVAAAASAAAAASTMTDCGSDVFAGPDTSCPFALIVEQAWASAGNGDVTAYSPVTGLNYVMDCESSNPVVCTGGNNASVQIGPSSAVAPPQNWQQPTINNVVEPSLVGFSGDGGNIFSVSGGWSSWGSASTTASGTVNYQDCVPDCADGSETPYPTTVTFSGLTGGKYTSVTETIQAGPDTGTTTSAVTSTWPYVQ
jgi:hypothetical protein